MSLTRVDLPEPETPVTATKQPSGNATSMSRRLCSRAPRTTICSPEPRRRLSGTRIEVSPVRYWPVREAFSARRPATSPE